MGRGAIHDLTFAAENPRVGVRLFLHEGERSIDFRGIATGAIGFDRDPPYPLLLQQEIGSEAHGNAELAGVLTRGIRVDSENIMAEGHLAANVAGAAALALISQGILQTWSPDIGNPQMEPLPGQPKAPKGEQQQGGVLVSGTFIGATLAPFPSIDSAVVELFDLDTGEILVPAPMRRGPVVEQRERGKAVETEGVLKLTAGGLVYSFGALTMTPSRGNTLERRIADLEAQQLRRELPQSIAAALESRPKTKQEPTLPTPDKEQNRTAIWNMVQALPGWEKAPGGARYIGSKGIGMLTGKAGEFTAGGTSSPSKPYDTLEEAVAAVEQIGGAPKGKQSKMESEEGETPHDDDDGGTLQDRARDAVVTALGGSKESEETSAGLRLQKRIVKVEIPVEGLATRVSERAKALMEEEPELSEEEAMARAVEDLVPKLPRSEEEKALQPRYSLTRQEGGKGTPAEENPEAPAPEESKDPNAELKDKIAEKAAALIDEGTDPKDAVKQAIDAVLAEMEPAEGNGAENGAKNGEVSPERIEKAAQLAKQMPDQMMEGLCESMAGEEHMWQACMDKDFGEFEPEDKEAFCAWMKRECEG